MKLYIIERNNPMEWIEPEIVLDGNEAFQIVRNEYEKLMEELGTSQEIADSGYGGYGCYWYFEDGKCVGSASIDSDYDGDRYQWRITEHVIDESIKKECA